MVYAPTRREAIQKMAVALKQTSIQGAPNNLEFLRVGLTQHGSGSLNHDDLYI
jgi:biotin carboxylase